MLELATLGPGRQRLFSAYSDRLRRELERSHIESARRVALLEVQRIEMEQIRLEAAGRAKDQFLSHMSHELRTPLNAIIGFSEIMAERPFGALGEARFAEYARDIRAAGTHLLDLINDILDLSKIAAGKLGLDEAPVDVVTVIEDCVSLMRVRAETAGLVLVADLPAQLPPLRADCRRLKQIVLNLVSNAVNYTERGEVRVGAAIDAGQHVVSVRDTGIGMSADNIVRALSPFSQIDDPRTRRNRGTGLGLSITKALVDLHGGTLEIDSRVDVGTLITVRFPRERTE